MEWQRNFPVPLALPELSDLPQQWVQQPCCFMATALACCFLPLLPESPSAPSLSDLLSCPPSSLLRCWRPSPASPGYRWLLFFGFFFISSRFRIPRALFVSENALTFSGISEVESDTSCITVKKKKKNCLNKKQIAVCVVFNVVINHC